MKLLSPPEEPTTVRDFQRLKGIWRSIGYGKLLVIEASGYVFHEETAVSCLAIYEGSLRELAERYVDLEVAPGGQAFSARRATGVTRVRFRRLKALPATVEASRNGNPEDPEYNFEIFWHTFAQQYAFFDLKGVNWSALYQRYRHHIGPETEPDALFSVLCSMLKPLRDGHVRLHSDQRHYSSRGHSHLYQRLYRELDNAGDHRDVSTYLSELLSSQRARVHEDYLEESPGHAGHRLLTWGRLGERIGYLDIRAMAGQSGHIGDPEADLAVIDHCMPRLLAELGTLPWLVVDLRSNGGGYDAVALRLAGFLTDRRRLAFTKSARRGEGFTGKQPVYLDPATTQRYQGRLIVLTSELTASAAEIFVLALMQHPRLIRLGESTHGILSDTLERHLPNGWHMTLSNEIYRAHDGTLFEDQGIPPTESIEFLGWSDRENGRDTILDRAITLAS